MLREGDYVLSIGDSDDDVEAGGDTPNVVVVGGGNTDADPPSTQLPTDQTPADGGGNTAAELQPTQSQVNQVPAAAPGTVVESAEPTRSGRSKKKRSRVDSSASVGGSSLSGRHIHYSDVGFVEDKRACASVLYALKHPDAPTNIPPLSELEESKAYIKFARSEMRSKALLNKMVLSYQKKLTDARQSLKDAEQLDELKAEMKKLHCLAADSAMKLQEQKSENNLLQSSLTAKTEEFEQSEGRYQRACAELKSLGGYSKDVKARADRLQKRLVYLDEVKAASTNADQARSSFGCVQQLLQKKSAITPKLLERMEKHAKEFEAEVEKFVPFVLEEGDLTPLGAYVPVSNEFGELLGTEALLPLAPPASDNAAASASGTVQDPALAP